MRDPAMPAAKEFGELVPTPSVPEIVPTVSPPENVDVPRPETLIRFAMLTDVEEATGNVEATEVEVASKKFPATLPNAVTGPVNTPAPWTARSVPGAVVPMPRLPEESRRARSMPFVEMPTMLAPAEKKPVSESLRKASEGVAALPSPVHVVFACKSGRSSEPANVEVPMPETVIRFAMLNEVELAIGKMEASAVEVALKIFAVSESVMTPAPTTESGALMVEVALMPRKPLDASTLRKFAESRAVTPE